MTDIGALSGLGVPRGLETETGDGSRRTLLNPTSREWMREMTTGRTDKIESPSTVNAGHCPSEGGVVSHAAHR